MKPRLPYVAALLILAWSSAASAQVSRPERPYRGLFRGGPADQPLASLLALTVSLGGGYDDNVFADTLGGTSTAEGWESGGFGRLFSQLAYTKNTDRVSLGATVGADARYFPELDTEYYGAYSTGLAVDFRVGRNGRIGASQSVAYQPFLTINLFPVVFDPALGMTPPAAQERGTPFGDSYLYRTALEFSQRVSRRGVIAFSYTDEFNDFDAISNDFRLQGAGGRYTHEVGRGVGLRMGYRFGTGRYPDSVEAQDLRGHVIDAGVDYSKALSISRRTSLSFGTGTSAFSTLDETRYALVGDARLNHEIGRTWRAGLAYSRDVAFVRTFDEPFLSDSVAAELTGLAGRRLEVGLMAAASFGDVGVRAESNEFRTYSATSTLTYGLTRHLGLSAQYAFYRYRFEEGVTLPVGLIPEADRQSVSLSLTVWVPLYQRARSSR